MAKCDMGRGRLENAIFASDVLEEMIYDMSIRNFLKLVHEMVVLILTFLRIYFHIFDINRNLAKLKLGRMAFYNNVPNFTPKLFLFRGFSKPKAKVY